jgi:class 3 adenylate cyclase
MDFTVIGPPVSEAEGLESLSAHARGSRIVVSRSVIELIPEAEILSPVCHGNIEGWEVRE